MLDREKESKEVDSERGLRVDVGGVGRSVLNCVCVCLCVVLTPLLKDWHKSALTLEILDTCAPRACSIASDIVKSNSMALWSF